MPTMSATSSMAETKNNTEGGAESALFEQHRVNMVGGYPELEDELCSLQPGHRIARTGSTPWCGAD